jgi:hypothetical protein
VIEAEDIRGMGETYRMLVRELEQPLVDRQFGQIVGEWETP